LDKNEFHYQCIVFDFWQLLANAFDFVKSARLGAAKVDLLLFLKSTSDFPF
jgi:hypothetical protein